MSKIDSIFHEETKRADLHPKRITKWIHYTKLKTNKAQYRYGNSEEDKLLVREQIVALADLISADGEVLQDLLVRKTDPDEYEIVAGHFRRDACKLLVEERGQEKFALLPCIIKNVSDVRAEFQVYSSNGYGKKTQYEIMCELEGMQHLLDTYPEEFPDIQGGRMVERLAKRLNMKKTTVGEYQKISHDLADRAMEKFRDGTLKKSAALTLSTLPAEEQDKLLEQGVTSNTEITRYKQNKDPDKHAAGQAQTDEGTVPPVTGGQRVKERPPVSEDKETDVPNFGTEEKFKAPPLPRMKNMEDRESFVLNYKTWGIWAVNDLTEETYYRRRLPDASAIVVREYPYMENWSKKECLGMDLFLLTEETGHFRDAATSMTAIKEHLKRIERGKDAE